MQTLGNLLRRGLVLATFAVVFAASWQLFAPERAGALTGGDLATVLVCAAAWAWQLALGWLLLLTTLVVWERVELAHSLGCPQWLRRGLITLCGVSAVALTLPAHAGSPADPGTRSHALDGLPLPDRVTGTTERSGPAPTRSRPRTVLVRPGDTVWAFATEQLRARDSEARPADIARQSARIAARNRLTDPDLIHPGDRLRLPPTPTQEEQ